MAATAKSEEKDELTCLFFFFFFSPWVSADRIFRNVSAALEPRKPEERGDGFHSAKPFQRDRSAFVPFYQIKSFLKSQKMGLMVFRVPARLNISSSLFGTEVDGFLVLVAG